MHRAIPSEHTTQLRGRERSQHRQLAAADQSAPLGRTAVRSLDQQRHPVVAKPIQNRLTPRDRLAAAPGEAQEIADALPQAGNDERAKIARNSDGAPRCLGEGALLQRLAQHIFPREQP